MTTATEKKTINNDIPPAISSQKRIRIHIGGVHASVEPIVIDTVLGSCIAVCLYDSKKRIGGMNHFMLPEGEDPKNPTSTRYGVHAMELLISDMMKLGAHRKNFQAKIFGGGHVLKIRENLDGVPQRNISFIRRFLDTERIPVVKEDVGGYQPRRVLFSSESGKVWMRKLGKTEIERTAQEEVVYLLSLKRKKTDGKIELF